MNKRELRLRILQALSDWEHSGERYLPKAGQIAEGLGVDLQDIIDQFDILDVEGAVDNRSKYYGDKKKDNMASITGFGESFTDRDAIRLCQKLSSLTNEQKDDDDE